MDIYEQLVVGLLGYLSIMFTAFIFWVKAEWEDYTQQNR